MIILILLTFVLQTTLMQTFAIASVSPNLPIILTVSFALMRGKREGMFVGAFFGILMDIFYGPVLGFHMLLFTYVGYFNGFCYRIFYDDDIKMPVLDGLGMLQKIKEADIEVQAVLLTGYSEFEYAQ